ncbi:M23 family metallopeptidase [Glutamicibacter sp.]|uniref:M23 family metallopeptidase n=1 Tax=Glutamicibacter sp. TaxID=1931995 RepID=UPI002B480E50|nr:M23 family metallopeptidase [Glutamicibacter sp.]HJX78106.1 M23 family metallopeptidase [Glutamicibacter sp.]
MKRTKRRGIFAVLGLIIVLLFGMVFGGILLLGDSPSKATETETDCSPDSTVPKEINVKNLPTTKVGSYNKQQLTNAAIIINEAKKAEVKQQGAIIGLMTAIQESSLRVLANDGTWKYPEGTNVMTEAQWAKARKVVLTSLDLPHQGVGHAWDAISLMQQRPSAGWGTVEQIMDPSYAASTFFSRLKKVPDWQSLPYEVTAEKVQVSGLPDNYADQRPDAELLYAALQGATVEVSDDEEAYAQCKDEGDTRNPDSGDPYEGPKSNSGWVFPVENISKIQYNYGENRGLWPHAGEDFSSPKDTPIYAAADGQVIRASCSDLVVGRSPCQVQVDHGTIDGQRVSTLYVHMYEDGVLAQVGDEVKAGEQIAKVGTNGNSTGYHLHFEVWLGKADTNPVTFLKEQGVSIPG